MGDEGIKGNLISIVHYLADTIGERSYQRIEELNKAADFIEERFNSCKCIAERQHFSYKGNTFFNIAAEVKGAGPSEEGILVVGAHYDTVVETPGADDNASGVAGMLELARLAQLRPFRKTTRFVAFTLEEPPFFMTARMGSHIYAGDLRRQGVRVSGMISLEMLGYYSDHEGSQFFPIPFLKWFYPDIGNYIAFVGNMRSKAFTKKLKESFRRFSALPVESLNAPSIVPGVDFSDHRSFWKFGFPALMITDTAFYRNPNYHGMGDTPATIDYDRMESLVIGLSKALRDL